MPTSKQIIDIVYKTVTDSNLSRVLPVLHEQIVLHVPPNVPFGGEYHGRSGFLALMSKVFRLWNSLKLTSLTYFTPDDSLSEVALVAVGKFEGKLPAIDEPMSVPFIHYWQLKDGKVVSLRAFYWDIDSLLTHFPPKKKGPDRPENGQYTSESGNLPD
jgi:ketosteroid isomerase-like protein